MWKRMWKHTRVCCRAPALDLQQLREFNPDWRVLCGRQGYSESLEVKVSMFAMNGLKIRR